MTILPLLAAADPMDEVLRHTLFGHGWYAVTNQMVMALVAGLLMLLIFPYLFPKPDASAPRGAKNFFESILEYLRIEVFRPALKEHTDRFVPFLWTLFFILFSNLLGQLPIAEVITLITGKESHWGGTATGTLTTTATLAIFAFFFIHINGIVQVARSLIDGSYGHGHHDEHSSDGHPPHEASHDLEHSRGDALAADVPGDFRALSNPTGHYKDDEHPGHRAHTAEEAHQHMNPVVAVIVAFPLYMWNFAPHPLRPPAGAAGAGALVSRILDLFLWAFLLALELIGAVIKPFALSIRLFANMIAGHIVLGSLLLLIPLGSAFIHQIGVGAPITLLSLMIRALELFVCFLQAYIFVFLVTLFIGSAVAPEH